MGTRAIYLLLHIVLTLSLMAELDEKSIYFQSLIKYERNQFGEKEYKNINRLTSKANSREDYLLISLLARYERELNNSPVNGLKILSSHILNSDIDWVGDYNKEKVNSLKKWNEAVHEAKKNNLELPEKPKAPYLNFPSISKWTISSKNSSCIIEAALCLSELNNTKAAISSIDKAGKEITNGYFRCIALEGAADIFQNNRLLEKSLGLYKSSLQFLKFEKSSEGLSELEKYTKKRIQHKIRKLQKLIDIEKYGKGFVDYRRARYAHLKDKALLESILYYESIMEEHKNTIYDEASRAYKTLVYLELSKKISDTHIKKSLLKANNKIKDVKLELANAKKARLPTNAINKITLKLNEAEHHLKTLKLIPTGQDALKISIKQINGLCIESKYGLYRGELMTEAGKYFILEQYDTRKANIWLDKADSWFSEVKNVDAVLNDFKVPDKAKKVSQPPKNERKEDFFGNILKEEVAPYSIFHRRSCGWYLGYIHKDVKLYKGFLLFSDKKYDSAKEIWKSLYDLDSYFEFSEKKNHGSVVARLIWNCNNNKGALYATPEEFKYFTSKKLRIAVLLADLDYENEEHKEAAEKYAKIEAGQFGKLSKKQAAYINYAIAANELYGLNIDKSWKKRLLKFRDEYKDTPSELRGLFAAAAAMACNPASKTFPEGIEIFKYIHEKFPKTSKGEDSLFHLGKIYGSNGDAENCKKYIELYFQKYPGGKWTEHAEYLKKKNYNDSDWWKE